MEPTKYIKSFLEDFKKSGLFPNFPIIKESGTTPHIKVDGEEYLMFSSNNYLSLANNQEVLEKASAILRIHGCGPGGSRFLCGNLEYLRDFEERLAQFVGVEGAITFPTGYMANLSVFSALLDPFIFDQPTKKGAGTIFSDAANHATIVDGCRISSAKKVIYQHNDLEDLLSKIHENHESQRKFIVSESVYSTDGLVTDVNKIVNIANDTSSIIMIDDAHGLGVIGRGRGAIHEFKLKSGMPHLYMATLDKALGSTGGFLGGNKSTIEFLRITSRPYLFSSALPAVQAAAADASMQIILKNPEIVDKVLSKAHYIRERLRNFGFQVIGNDKTTVAPILIGDDQKGIRFSDMLFERKVYAPCFRWPAAPINGSRIRVSVMADHSDSDLETFLEASKVVGKKLSII